ncbi:ribosomal protein S21 [Candidatus Phytoplasma oryzae]|uniref:Small ribosomal subunit protein bS21 n=1 Tax=Candidatus Phytoplasma oryzae TaxID=203274 RepID=A0A139JQS5_9MOLU|nr:30S ribosomal protein S21 [Candidatus Phytoplasma oryzae]KXT29331.1 ribosomal protein S21 [Candidatus Phytoplasma oryzae]RAM57885.1 30S ribosomal protein S21 [Candidatus Phytoplasma oryzae]
MTKVFIKEGENLDDTLRRFRREVSRSGILAQYRSKEYYIKPSVARKARIKNNMKKRKKFILKGKKTHK